MSDVERVIVHLPAEPAEPTAEEVARWRARENGYRARTGQPPLPADAPMVNPYIQPGYRSRLFDGKTKPVFDA